MIYHVLEELFVAYTVKTKVWISCQIWYNSKTTLSIPKSGMRLIPFLTVWILSVFSRNFTLVFNMNFIFQYNSNIVEIWNTNNSIVCHIAVPCFWSCTIASCFFLRLRSKFPTLITCFNMCLTTSKIQLTYYGYWNIQMQLATVR